MVFIWPTSYFSQLQNKYDLPNKSLSTLKHNIAVLQYAESKGWRVGMAGKSAHPWGFISCSLVSPDGCRKSVYSTPKVPERHARELKRFVDKCPHNDE